MSDHELMAEGIHFGEGPRWHEGRLWFSDMHARRVCRLDPTGTGPAAVETVLTLDEEPSGLGWLPGGELLIVAMPSRRLLRWDGAALAVHAELEELAAFHCNDMVVGPDGTAWVGNFGFDLHGGAEPRTANLIRVAADGRASIAASEMMFANGTVLTPDLRTLIVGESFAGRLTAFDIEADGTLAKRRIWATLPEGAVPDGICLDTDGAIWSASPTTREVIRQREGGEVTHRIGFDRGAYACMLGDNGLYVLLCEDSHPDACRQHATGQVVRCAAPYGRAGWP